MKRSIALAASALVLVACGSGDGADASGEGAGGLVFERADGSRIEFADNVRVVCERPDTEAPTSSVRIAAGGELGQPEPFWLVQAPTGIEGERVNFPPPEPERELVFVFVNDPEDGNELSSFEEESSGEVVFHELGCALGDPVRFAIDARLGSELANREGIRVRGEFRGSVASGD